MYNGWKISSKETAYKLDYMGLIIKKKKIGKKSSRDTGDNTGGCQIVIKYNICQAAETPFQRQVDLR